MAAKEISYPLAPSRFDVCSEGPQHRQFVHSGTYKNCIRGFGVSYGFYKDQLNAEISLTFCTRLEREQIKDKLLEIKGIECYHITDASSLEMYGISFATESYSKFLDAVRVIVDNNLFINNSADKLEPLLLKLKDAFKAMPRWRPLPSVERKLSHTISFDGDVEDKPTMVNTDNPIVREIQKMFKRIHELNYYGLRNGQQVCSLGCLKCSTIMTSVEEFVQFGPALGTHPFFCQEDTKHFNMKLKQLEMMSKQEGKDFQELYECALKPMRELEKPLKETSVAKAAAESGTEWVYLR